MASTGSGSGPTEADMDHLRRLKDAGVTMTVDKMKGLKEAVAMLSEQVMIGIPAEAAERSDPAEKGIINNAQIGYINEFGVPERNIPARPHLVPGVQAVKDGTTRRLKAAANAALDGAPAKVKAQLNAIGLEAVSSVRAIITAGIPPPLSSGSIQSRMTRKTRNGMPAPQRQGRVPLIDTGDYIRHITYVIRKVIR